MPESETKGTSGGITTGATGTIIDGITAKTVGTGAGGLTGMRLIVPSTNFTERNREHIGSIATNIQMVTIAANSPVLSLAITPGMAAHSMAIPALCPRNSEFLKFRLADHSGMILVSWTLGCLSIQNGRHRSGLPVILK